MINRFKLATIPLLTIIMLSACSSKPPRSNIPKNGWTPSQSSNQHRHYPLYTDDDVDSGRSRRSYSQEFPRPPEIEPQVAFWRKVYSKWGRSQVAIHDKVHMDIIYDVFDLPGGSSDIMTFDQKDYIQQRMADWRARLSILEDKVASGASLDGDEKELVEFIAQKTGRKNAIQGSSERLRQQRGMKERFMRGVEIGQRYDAQFRRIFRNAGLPEDLALLPHVESSFQYNAHSSAGALGIWQFTSGAAKMFMNGDSSAAARLDPINSTHGAARYLAYAYDKLGSWPLAVTSYNHGIGGMQRAKNAHGHDFVSIVKHYNGSAFGFASRNYYAEFLAARDIVSDPSRYISDSSDTEHYAAMSNIRPVSRTREMSAPVIESPETIQALEESSTPSLPEPTVIAQEEPKPVDIQPVRLNKPAPAQTVSSPEPIATIPTPVEAIYQPEPTPAAPTEVVVAESTDRESSEAEELDSEEASPRRAKAAKSTKVAAATFPKKTGKQAVPVESKMAPGDATINEPKKPAWVKPPVDSKKASKALVSTDGSKGSKAKEISSETKKATKFAHPAESKLATKTSPATIAPKSSVKGMASAKSSQTTPVKMSQNGKSKLNASKQEDRKSSDKIRIAKR